ncbi:transmembrane domain-containing protein [Cryptosporidium canis]|uniref:Transmembrane domain-containing protein n=1 Tax=Cryptosporidium canis TaxID=195482 RepID=A0ABQ8PAZ8_9CRYT|nr:transmembrane domain-containing protein [Cryptosporidium canis]
MDNNFIVNNILEGSSSKYIECDTKIFDNSLIKYGIRESEGNSEAITLFEDGRKLKDADSSFSRMIKDINKEKLVEELMIDLSSLLVRLRNTLGDFQLESFNIDNDVTKKAIIDLIRVCISVGLRVGDILEEKCMEFEERCFILNRYSLSYSWFTYWSDNISKNNNIPIERQELSVGIIESFGSQNTNITSDEVHICTINCVKYEKFISDFKMLSKIANSLFNKAFTMSIWSAKDERFVEIEHYTLDEETPTNFNMSSCYKEEQDYSHINKNKEFIISDLDESKCTRMDYRDYQFVHKGLIDENKLKFEIDCDEELNESLSSNINCILLPKMIVCSASNTDFNSTLESSKIDDIIHLSDDKFDLRSKSLRTSIIMENIDIESLIECKHKTAKLRHSMIKMREVQTEIYKLIIEGTGEIDYLEEQSALAQVNTAQGATSVAKGCKSKAKWWPIHGSTAGLVCGGAAGLILGPFGVSFGAAVGGALGLTFGNMMKNHCHEKMDDIIQECEARTSKRYIKHSRNLKAEHQIIQRKSNSIASMKEENHLEFCMDEKKYDKEYIQIHRGQNNGNGSILRESYNTYISSVPLSDILDNVDIIP